MMTITPTLSDLDHPFDRLYSSPFSNNNTRDILVIIGLIAICLLLFLLIIQFILRVRQVYRTSEPEERCRKSYQTKFPSYQNLLYTDNNQRKCFQYSCLPKFQCIKPPCQIVNRSSHYEQINENQLNNSLHRSCICVHVIE